VPPQARTACSKFLTTRRPTGLTMTRSAIARPGRSRRHSSTVARATSTQASREASSDSTISIGGRVCRQMLRTCSRTKRSPL